MLKEIDIFSGLSAEELAAIATVTKELGYPGDKNVIRQGEMGETVFLIIDGKVAVIREQEDGSSIVLDQMESGAAFGEMALIDDAPRSATIKTLTPCRFLILHKQEFKETAMEFPRIALGICSVPQPAHPGSSQQVQLTLIPCHALCCSRFHPFFPKRSSMVRARSPRPRSLSSGIRGR